MESEKYFTEQAQALMELLPRSCKKPLHKKASGMLHGEKAVLLYLSDHERVTAGELSRALQIGSGGVANVLNALEGKGLLLREQGQSDRRKVLVSLSDSGRAEIERHKAEMLGVWAKLLTELGKDDTEELLRIFRKLIAIGDAMYEEKLAQWKGAEDA